MWRRLLLSIGSTVVCLACVGCRPKAEPTFTLLFRSAVDPTSLRTMMQDAGVIAGDESISIGEWRFRTRLSPASYSQKADRRLVARDFDVGRSSLTIWVEPQTSTAAWTENGWARVLLKAIRGVEKHLVGVVVHQAGEVMLDTESFEHRIGALDDGEGRAFTAFLDLGIDRARKVVSSYGMRSLGLPEVFTPVASLEDDVEFDRAHEAIMYACNRMSWEAGSIRDGAVLDVPAGLEVSQGPIEEDNPDMRDAPSVRWTVHADGNDLRLTRESALIDLARLWTAAASDPSRPLSFVAYRRLYFRQLEKELDLVRIATKTFYRQRPPVPIAEVRVYRDKTGHFLMSTCGYGRIVQPGGSQADGSAHIELALELSDHHPQIANAISLMGFGLHAKSPGDAPIKPGDRLRQEILGFDRFLLLPMRTLSLAKDGPSVAILSPLPLTPEEYNLISDRHTYNPEDYDQTVRDRWLGATDKPL